MVINLSELRNTLAPGAGRQSGIVDEAQGLAPSLGFTPALLSPGSVILGDGLNLTVPNCTLPTTAKNAGVS